MKITRERSGFLCLFFSIFICVIISSSIVETTEIKNVVLENEIVKPVNSNIITEDVMRSKETSNNDTVLDSKQAKK